MTQTQTPRTSQEYFLWSSPAEVEVVRGTPHEHGHDHTVTVATFNVDELSEDVAMNHAYALLSFLQKQGRNVRWPEVTA